MQVTLPLVVAIIIRGEGSKVPVTVFPHEVEILKALHGSDSVEVSDIDPTVAEGKFDTLDEYARLQEYYKGNVDIPNPTQAVFRNIDEFESAFAAVVGESKADLLARAQELGIEANNRWSTVKIKQAIAEVEGEE